MTTRISINGQLGDSVSSTISVLDRGFLYGDSVYEVMRTYGGRPFAVDDHLARLRRSADLLGIRLPVPIPTLVTEVRATLAAAANPECYIRLIVTRGSGPIGLDPALAVDPCRVIIVTELRQLDEQLYQQGVKVCLVGTGRIASSTIPLGVKSSNYLNNLMALRTAREHGAHEALLLDAEGRVAEGTTSNFFAVFDGKVCTPPLEVGLLEGITRSRVIQLARSDGLRVEQATLGVDDLKCAQELFLTSTLREILPIVQVDDCAIGDGRPGPTTRKLRTAFRDFALGSDQ